MFWLYALYFFGDGEPGSKTFEHSTFVPMINFKKPFGKKNIISEDNLYRYNRKENFRIELQCTQSIGLYSSKLWTINIQEIVCS